MLCENNEELLLILARYNMIVEIILRLLQMVDIHLYRGLLDKLANFKSL